MRSLPATGLLLMLLAVSVGFATTLLTATPSHAEGGATEIVFAAGPDESGIVKGLLDAFNKAHEGKIRVTWRVMDRDNNAHRGQLVKELESGKSAIDSSESATTPVRRRMTTWRSSPKRLA